MAMYRLPGFEGEEDLPVVTAPTEQGRSYIGPKLTDEQVAAIPQGARIVTNPETPTSDQQQAMASRIAAATSGPARQMVSAPSGGGVQMPDTTEFVRRAFNSLPVEQASKAVEAAEQLIARNGYQKDIQNGMPSNTALAKWGPMLFKGASGLATIERMSGGMTPYQKTTTELQQQRLKLAQQPKTLTEAQKAIADRSKERLAFQREQFAAKGVPTEVLKVPIDPANLMAGTRTFKQARTNAPAAVTAPAATTAPAAVPAKANPMPSKKADLVKGQAYQTARGVATWDGEKFVK